MIRRLLFILFLYILLAWIVAAYLHSSDVRTLVSDGLLWTAIGVALLLIWIILDWIIRWSSARRAERASKPAEPAQPAPGQQLHEDDLALLALLREADQRLAQAPATPGARPPRLSELPLYLVIGPERAGKTSLLQNSGVEPSLLAGQIVSSGSAVMSTKVANLWLAQQSLFLEIGGRVFGGEARRFAEFLSHLVPNAGKPKWLRWLGSSPVTNLRGVLLLFDAQKFTGTPEPSELDRQAQQIRERLFAAATVFGPDLPVYALFTKVDSVRYFPEFFGRLADSDAGQIFGVMTAGRSKERFQDRIWAEAETKRLNQQFLSLFLRLSDRRLLALAQETKVEARSTIYEFPREFKRIRTHLVQFLIDVFKPDPLTPGPQLRGFFFSGTRKAERLAPRADVSSVYQSTGQFSADATQIFSAEMRTSYGKLPLEAGPGRQADHWVFVTDFFNKILRGDRPVVVRAAPGFERYRRIAVGVAAALGLLISLVWTVSWFGNSALATQFKNSIGAIRRGNNSVTLANLRVLDDLRRQILELENRSPFRLHWGLYTGDSLLESARSAYFTQLRRLALGDLNEQLVSDLQHAGPGSGGASAGVTYDRLKTHRTITALGCPVDERLVSRVLKASSSEVFPSLTDEQKLLLNAQLDYYASELGASSKPLVSLAENPEAEAVARSYLQRAGGLDQQLNLLLAAVDRQTKTLSVADFADHYQLVLTGQAEIRGAFTKQGLALFQQLVSKGNGGGAEACVMGDAAVLGHALQKTELQDQLLSMYYRQYADAWRSFLASYKVIRYASPEDGARRLGILAGSTSPMLAIVRLVATNTNFQLPKPGELSGWEKGAKKYGLGGAVDDKAKAVKTAQQVEQAIGPDTPRLTTADLARLFQPVAFTTPPDVDRLVNDNDADYVKGLRALGDSLDNMGRAAAAERATVIPAARTVLTQAKNSQVALADKFFDVGNEGLNKQLADLLEQPIRLAELVIPSNTEAFSGGKKNGELAQFCRVMAPILAKYPFSGTSQSDATLIDIAKAFSPNDGLVSKYVQQSGSDLVVRKGSEWQPNPALQGMKVAPELLQFLNRSEELTEVLFSEGGMMQPKLRYVLRPVPGQNIVVRLVLDGKELNSQDPLQKTFYWPAPPGSSPGAEGTVQAGTFTTGFGRFEGLWGVFRLFQNADDRTFGAKEVQWSEIRGLGKSVVAQPLNPPAKVEFVEFPGGKDLFNPSFFEALQCPRKAVTVN
jgi:type VI secretion system protein ImpL